MTGLPAFDQFNWQNNKSSNYYYSTKKRIFKNPKIPGIFKKIITMTLSILLLFLLAKKGIDGGAV